MACWIFKSCISAALGSPVTTKAKIFNIPVNIYGHVETVS